MSYDNAMQSILLFGGGITDFGLDDTWAFSGTAGWRQLFPVTSPPGTSGGGFAYDPIGRVAVLFGGNPGDFVYVNTTWTWNGTTWRQHYPAASPSARAFNTEPMAYDGGTGKIVLFGGYANGGSSVLGDTWEWDGITWIERFPPSSPSPRAATLAYDAAHKEIVLFGGQAEGGNGPYLADTWTWDGVTWTQRFPTASPSARGNQMMAYDFNVDRVVLFGGSDGQALNDTWLWDGINWTQIQTTVSPSGRSGAAMSYDPGVRGLMLFGGSTSEGFTNETWILTSRP